MPLPIAQNARQASHACIGVVKAVGNLRPSKNNEEKGTNYSVLDVTIAPKYALRNKDEVTYFTYDPKFFDQNGGFNLSELTKGELFVLVSNVGSKDPTKPAALQALLGGDGLWEHFEQWCEEKISPTAEEVATKLKEIVVGEKVGYVLSQATDRVVVGQKDDGSPKYETIRKDFMQVERLFGPKQLEGIEAAAARAVKSAEKKDEKPLFVTHWEEGENPFDA